MPVKVKGLKELQRTFRKLDKSLKRQLQAELRQVAKPAADRARQKAEAMHLSHPTVTGIRPGSRVGMAIVRQNRRATTHKRPDFGVLQMKRVLYPAAEETMPEAEERLRVMLDNIANEFEV